MDWLCYGRPYPGKWSRRGKRPKGGMGAQHSNQVEAEEAVQVEVEQVEQRVKAKTESFCYGRL